MGIFSVISGWFRASSSSESEEGLVCACGGQCTCKEEPKSAIAAVQAPPRPAPVPPPPPAPPAPPEPIDDADAVQATFPEMDELPVKVRKIEDASILPPISPKKMVQPKLPGFEDTAILEPKVQKKVNSKKVSTKMPRKSTTKRKK